jgi:multidrug resistance efflux pump
MARGKGPTAPLGEEAARRQAERDLARATREAEALRANLQRRKAQARERLGPGDDAVDGSTPDRQRKDSA